MGDEGDRHTSDRRQFEARIAELEGRLRTVEGEPRRSDDHSIEVEAELRVLREALDDLASDVFDLHNQMGTLVSACERILAGAAGGGHDVTLDRDIGARGSSFVVRRAARRAVRATLGAARRVLGSGSQEEIARATIKIRPAAASAARSPAIAVVVETKGDPQECDAPRFFGNQTAPDTEIVVWNTDRGLALVHGGGNPARSIEATSRSALIEKIGADFVAEPMDPARPLLPTVLEMCRWTLASERLPLIVSGFPAGGRLRVVLTVHDAEHWCNGRDRTAEPGGPTVAKLVGASCQRISGAVSGPVVASEGSGGAGYLLGDAAAGVIYHEVAALDGVVSAADLDDTRPSVVVVSPLSGGAFEFTMWLLRGLGHVFRFAVILTEDCGEKARLVRAMAELAPATYPVANFLDPSVWSSVVTDVARAYSASTVLRIGDAGSVNLAPADGRRIIDLPLDPSEIGSNAEIVVALGGLIAASARQAGLEVVSLRAAPSVPPEPPDPVGVAAVRSGLGIPTDHRLVVNVADLVPEQRPEDFVAVANRMRLFPGLHFLLVGEGELTGTVSDIARYFGLENFTLAPKTHGTFELVLAADIVVSTAERDPWPTTAVAALALGRYLVATDLDGHRELAAQWAENRVTLVQPGDIVGLADAVESAVSGMRKPRVTKKAWKIAQGRTKKNVELMAEVLHGPSVESKGDS